MPSGRQRSALRDGSPAVRPGVWFVGVDARQVDERDSGWEDSSPLFRVYLFDRGNGVDYYATDMWDLTGVDVLEALRWAQERAGEDRLYAIALVRDERLQPSSDPCRGLVWLIGMDWFDRVDGDPEGQRTKDRMVARRGRNVVADETS